MSLTSFSKWLLSKLGSIDTLSWYSFILGCIVVMWLLCYGIYRTLNSKWPLATSFIMRHLVYPHIFPRIPFIGTATRFEVLIVFVYLFTNTLMIIIGANLAGLPRTTCNGVVWGTFELIHRAQLFLCFGPWA